MKLTVLVHSRVLNFKPTWIVDVDDSPRVRGLLKTGHLELIAPHDFFDNLKDEKPQEEKLSSADRVARLRRPKKDVQQPDTRDSEGSAETIDAPEGSVSGGVSEVRERPAAEHRGSADDSEERPVQP